MSDFRELVDAIAPLGRYSRLGVAVSGGGDSMALLHLLHGLGGDLRVATVDHGLREAAGAEARMVAGVCAGLGVSHDILRWTGWDGSGNLQDQARRARYGLLADWGRDRGVEAIALGHTLDDQAETFLMRLARRAGVDGLAEMAAEFRRADMVFVRPMLGCRRADLRAFLRAQGQDWVEDPSNDDPRFERVRAREALQALRPLGIEAGALAQVAGHMAEAREALGRTAAEAAGRMVRLEAGDLVFDQGAFTALPREIARRLTVGALRFVAPSDYPPRAEPVSTMLESIEAGSGATLHGVRVLVRAGSVRFTRELEAVRDLATPTQEMWDGRWQLDGPHAPDLRVGVLGESGLTLCAEWRATGLPRDSLLATPAIWREETLVSAPIAGFVAGWQAKLAQNRADFVNSLLLH